MSAPWRASDAQMVCATYGARTGKCWRGVAERGEDAVQCAFSYSATESPGGLPTTLGIYTISVPAHQRDAVEKLSQLVTNGDEFDAAGTIGIGQPKLLQ